MRMASRSQEGAGSAGGRDILPCAPCLALNVRRHLETGAFPLQSSTAGVWPAHAAVLPDRIGVHAIGAGQREHDGNAGAMRQAELLAVQGHRAAGVCYPCTGRFCIAVLQQPVSRTTRNPSVDTIPGVYVFLLP